MHQYPDLDTHGVLKDPRTGCKAIQDSKNVGAIYCASQGGDQCQEHL